MEQGGDAVMAEGQHEKYREEHTQPTLPAAAGRGWRASRLLRRPVVNVRGVAEIGRISDVVFDPDDSRLAGLMIDTAPADGRLATIARRAFTAPNADYIPVERIVALNGDVATVDVEPGQLARMGRLPRLSQVRDLLVITLHGMGLGRMVDLLLDESGAAVTGYLLNPSRKAARTIPAAEPAEAEDVSETAAPAEASAPLPAHLRIIPASPRVRFGPALILVIDVVAPLVGREVRIEIPDSAGRGDDDQRDRRADPSGWHMLGVRGSGSGSGGELGGADGADARTSH
jgi:sporulation protein YlmC with PRC-barrel domain